jgi:hypothetical protein
MVILYSSNPTNCWFKTRFQSKSSQTVDIQQQLADSSQLAKNCMLMSVRQPHWICVQQTLRQRSKKFESVNGFHIYL